MRSNLARHVKESSKKLIPRLAGKFWTTQWKFFVTLLDDTAIEVLFGFWKYLASEMKKFFNFLNIRKSRGSINATMAYVVAAKENKNHNFPLPFISNNKNPVTTRAGNFVAFSRRVKGFSRGYIHRVSFQSFGVVAFSRIT